MLSRKEFKNVSLSLFIYLLFFQHVSFPQDFHSVDMASVLFLHKANFAERPPTNHCSKTHEIALSNQDNFYLKVFTFEGFEIFNAQSRTL